MWWQYHAPLTQDYTATNNSQSTSGRGTRGYRCLSRVPEMPCERVSALLNVDLMYEGTINRLAMASTEEIQWRQALHAGFHDLPFQKAWITAMVLQLTLKQALLNLSQVSHITASLIATASTLPMFQLALSQPGKRHHAAQCKSTRRPIPSEVDASTDISTSRVGKILELLRG